MIRICKKHGTTEHIQRSRRANGWTCRRCRQESVAKRRRKCREILVNMAGGCCQSCGYDQYIGALHFHHRDPSTKSFGLSERGLTKALRTLEEEARKCVLLCANCHAEVEGGVRTV